MSRANVRVRPATHDDAPEMAALVRSVDVTTTGLTVRMPVDGTVIGLAERIDAVLDEKGRLLLVACDDAGEIVGMLAARDDDLSAVETTKVLHVTHLLVAPAARRRGIGRAMLGAVVQVAEAQGIEHLVASAAAGSREGNRYLARLGFAPLVVRRVASTSTLRRSLGMTDVRDRVAVLRRARRIRAERVVFGPRAATRNV